MGKDEIAIEVEELIAMTKQLKSDEVLVIDEYGARIEKKEKENED